MVHKEMFWKKFQEKDTTRRKLSEKNMALDTLKRVAPSDDIWNKFDASHWLTEEKEGKGSNGRHETYFKWNLMAPHVAMEPSPKFARST